MKNTVLILTLIMTFASGYLIASQLAQSSPQVLEIPSQNMLPACEHQEPMDVTSVQSAAVADRQHSLMAQHPLKLPQQEKAQQALASKARQPAELSLAAYSSQVASQLPAATELIIQLDHSEFTQLLENHQQQQGGEMASIDYQQQLADFFAAQPALSLQQLDCRADLCLLQLELQDNNKWAQIFDELSAQPWWQSVSYQALSAQSAEGHAATTESRLLILQQQQIAALRDYNQTQMLADDGASQ